MPVDLNRIATAAAESYLNRHGSPNGRVEEVAEKGRHLGGVGAFALGVGLAMAAHAVYNRARHFDLERAAGKVEERLSS
jgi:hypothetical protein